MSANLRHARWIQSLIYILSPGWSLSYLELAFYPVSQRDTQLGSSFSRPLQYQQFITPLHQA